MTKIIRKVWARKVGNKKKQLLVTIPNDSDIRKGDYVLITKIREVK